MVKTFNPLLFVVRLLIVALTVLYLAVSASGGQDFQLCPGGVCGPPPRYAPNPAQQGRLIPCSVRTPASLLAAAAMAVVASEPSQNCPRGGCEYQGQCGRPECQAGSCCTVETPAAVLESGYAVQTQARYIRTVETSRMTFRSDGNGERVGLLKRIFGRHKRGGGCCG